MSPRSSTSADWQYASTTSGSQKAGRRRSRKVGAQKSSASASHTIPWDAARRPRCHWANGDPLFESLRRMTKGTGEERATSSVVATLSSLEASSRTITSAGGTVWARMLARRERRYRPEL